MVRRLVEQQQVGRGRQGPGQGAAPLLAAGQMRWVLVASHTELVQQGAGAVQVVAGTHAGLDIIEGLGEPRQVRLLRQIAHGGAGLQEPRAAILLQQPGGDL